MTDGGFSVARILGSWLFGKPRRARPGCDIVAKVEMELAEAARGTTRNIEINRHELCAECGGSGWRKGCFPPQCIECGSRGTVISLRRFFPVADTCPICAGREPPITDPCPECRGQGRISRVVGLVVEIPPGVESGMWLQLRNQGEPGDIGASHGNLRIQLLVKKHPVFERRNKDVYCQIAVSDSAMAEGTQVQVPTLDGTCPLRIPRETHHGDLLRIRGRGMPEIGGGGFGDLVVEVVLDTLL